MKVIYYLSPRIRHAPAPNFLRAAIALHCTALPRAVPRCLSRRRAVMRCPKSGVNEGRVSKGWVRGFSPKILFGGEESTNYIFLRRIIILLILLTQPLFSLHFPMAMTK